VQLSLRLRPAVPAQTTTVRYNVAVEQGEDAEEPNAVERKDCSQCGQLIAPPEGVIAFASATCDDCGRTRYRGPGPDGLKTKAGEDVTVRLPPISLEPGGPGHLFRPGLTMLVSKMMFRDDAMTADDIKSEIEAELEAADAFLRASPLLGDLDFDGDIGPELEERMKANPYAPERWALLVAVLGSAYLERTPIEGLTDAGLLWRLGKARAMFLFASQLEELAWRGYRTAGVDGLRAALTAWNSRTGNETEQDWQALIESNPWLVGLLTVGPVVLQNGRAYVGGKRFDNTGGHVVDFLLRNSIGGNAALLEIKRPGAQLVSPAEYRNGVHAIHPDLSGAIVQVATYRDSLLKEYNGSGLGDSGIVAFNPTCIVLAGDYKQLDTPQKRSSFELFRQSLQGLVIVTYDEFFSRVQSLLSTLGTG
jgi:hypothetical protein